MFIDTHCHFDFPPFIDEVDYSIAQMVLAHVNKIIVPSVSSDRFSLVLDLARQYPRIYAALGMHPIYKHKQDDLVLLIQALEINQDKIVAMGEIGLDGYIENADISEQLIFLRAQLDLAKQFHLPVILHSRKTHAVLWQELKKAQLPDSGVVHGFSGSYEEAMKFIQLGFYIGVGGVISYARAQKTRNAISRIPLDFIVLETDSPDMPLSGYQGRANRPENIVKIFKVLTELRSESLSHIQRTILTNTVTLFPRINSRE